MRGAAVVQSVDVHWKSLSSVRSPGDLWDALFNPTVTAQVAVVNRGNTFFNILDGSTTFASGWAWVAPAARLPRPATPKFCRDRCVYIQAVRTDPPFIGWTHLQTHLFYNDTAALTFDSPRNVLIVPWNLLAVVVWVFAVMWVAVRTPSQAPARCTRGGSPRGWANSVEALCLRPCARRFTGATSRWQSSSSRSNLPAPGRGDHDTGIGRVSVGSARGGRRLGDRTAGGAGPRGYARSRRSVPA